MPGNTGRMTSEAIDARGPRLCLTGIYDGRTFLGFVIRREGVDGTIINPAARLSGKLKNPRYTPYGTSYSLRYLLGIGRAALKERGTHQ